MERRLFTSNLISAFCLPASAAITLPLALASLLLVSACGSSADDSPVAAARVIAVGIPGAGTLSSPGRFLPGGPINDNADFKAFTEPGKMLDPQRVLVGSTSNFGAPLARPEDRPGAMLSIDTSAGDVIRVPPDFARDGTQATALNGRVQMYSAQTSAFLNRRNNSGAVTADLPGVSNPLDLSINNAFGRLWPANAPQGLGKDGSLTILDPTGKPLADPPNKDIGGVFAGTKANRSPQVIAGGLTSGVVATAFIGRAVDDPRRAVFVAVTADGAIAQAHTERALDGIAPAGTISDLRGQKNADELHAGAVLKYYTPEPVLYVSDPVKNEVVAITLLKDESGMVRKAGTIQRYSSKAFNLPVDLCPTVSEANSRDWSSNTTLSELADIYVLNRGNNTVTRMKVDGTVIATRRVELEGGKSLGSARLNGIATSPDGKTIYVSVTGKLTGYSEDGALLALASFASTPEH